MKKTRKGIQDWILYFILPIVIILIWQYMSSTGKIKSYAMPSPMGIVSVTLEYIKNGELWDGIVISFLRVLEGFLTALITAFILGIAVSLFQKIEVLTDLILQILRPIPPIAWIPLAILWFGIGEESKIFIIFMGAFFPVFVNIVDGVKSLDARYFELAKVYEVSKNDLILRVVLPGALPSIMTGIRLGIGNAWVCVVAAEMIGATKGIGYMLSNGRSLSRPDIVILGMLVVGIVGKLMDDVILAIREKVITWI